MHIDLNAKLRELEREKNPVTLELRDLNVTFRPRVTLDALLRLSAAPEQADDEDAWRTAALDFICALLIDEDQDAWIDATATRDLYPDELLDETLTWLSLEYTARPTSPSTASRAGRVNTGENSSSAASPEGSATSAA